MMYRHFLVAVLILWSNTNPTSQKGLKKRLDYLKLQMEELSLKTERVDKNIQIMKGEQGLPKLPKKYCQPCQPCWPNATEIEDFRTKINGDESSCLSPHIKKFVSYNDSEAHVQQHCYNYTGLNNLTQSDCKDDESKAGTGIYQTPNPHCDANPFITGARYNAKGLACMTPYQALNNRNFKHEWMAAFIVNAESPNDIKASIEFAKKHNLGISVINTGHEMQDRNAGPGPNTLLIRTTCFREWDPYPDAIPDEDKSWTDGFADVGAGLSFGENFWPKLENGKGLYKLAAEQTREIVGGTCRSVGIVGWSMGGGRGWTSPLYGLGVDQLLNVKLVTASGESVTATATNDYKDLFYAIKGGGFGFGIIHSIRIKLHKPRCREMVFDDLVTVYKPTMKNCYHMHVANWTGIYDPESTPDYLKNITRNYLQWSKASRSDWNSLYQLKYHKGTEGSTNSYSLYIYANNFGNSHSESFSSIFEKSEFDTDRIKFDNDTGKPSSLQDSSKLWHIKTDKYFCEIFPNYKNGSDCTDFPWHLERWLGNVRFLVNSSVSDEENNFVDDLIDSWQPCCDDNPYSPCASGYQIHGDLPKINLQTGKGVYASESPISTGFRKASWQVFNFDVNSNNITLTTRQKDEWMHSVLAPIMYRHSTASYFNEAEYTLDPGHWERRFWGEDNHAKLLKIKRKYDPDFVFGCRHCVGSEVGTVPADGGQ